MANRREIKILMGEQWRRKTVEDHPPSFAEIEDAIITYEAIERLRLRIELLEEPTVREILQARFAGEGFSNIASTLGLTMPQVTKKYIRGLTEIGYKTRE